MRAWEREAKVAPMRSGKTIAAESRVLARLESRGSAEDSRDFERSGVSLMGAGERARCRKGAKLAARDSKPGGKAMCHSPPQHSTALIPH